MNGDPRQVTGVAGRVVAALGRFNARHPWSHNDAFHGWILRRLPEARGDALDVGCGQGGLVVALAQHFQHVTGIDADAGMVRDSTQRAAHTHNVEIRQASFLDVEGQFDLITMIAVLHHMDHAVGLAHAGDLLRPGGRLLVVGLATLTSRRDLAWDLASAAVNPVVGLVKHPRAVTEPPCAAPFPVAQQTLSFDEIACVAGEVLPGARLRRRLFFRYTFEWTKPTT